MPTTRRRSAGTSKNTAGGQSTLSFAHRVTKNVPKDTKKSIISKSVAKIEPADIPTPAKDEVEVEAPVTEEVQPQPEVVEAAPRAPAWCNVEEELKAEKITDAQIKKHFREIESQRIAKPVHVNDLDLSERILRYFDVSSQYGPCIGISRRRRWHRAHRLGLNPPLEALAVLLKEEKKGDGDHQSAQIDRILNAISAGA